MEDYKKKYDESLERARKIYNQTEFDYEKGMMEEVFPELVESEDEKIRKELICFIETEIPQCAARDKYIVWLKKQGEQKPTLDTEIPFNAKDSELIEATYFIPKGFHAEIIGDEVHIKQGEQEPVEWSAEDKSNMQEICKILDSSKKYFADCKEIMNYIDWLKSLRPQSTWKPSKEQMKVLDEVIKNPHLSSAEYNTLTEIEEQLEN